MSLTMTGVVTKILQEESGTSKAGKEWKKGGFVINNGSEYNPDTAFGVFGEEKLKEIITFGVGQEVEVSFNLSSREFNGKYYTQADAWRVNVTEGAPAPVAAGGADDDDLPF